MAKEFESEKVIIESPMSFTGATKRIWPGLMKKSANKYVKWLVLFPIAVFVLYIVYAFILVWYLFFGLLLVPFRLLRRSSRNKKRNTLQHREMMEALAAKK